MKKSAERTTYITSLLIAISLIITCAGCHRQPGMACPDMKGRQDVHDRRYAHRPSTVKHRHILRHTNSQAAKNAVADSSSISTASIPDLGLKNLSASAGTESISPLQYEYRSAPTSARTEATVRHSFPVRPQSRCESPRSDGTIADARGG